MKLARQTLDALEKRLDRVYPPPAQPLELNFVYVHTRDWGPEEWVSRHLGYARGLPPESSGNAWAVRDWRESFPAWPNGRPDDSGPFDEWVKDKQPSETFNASGTIIPV